MTPDMLVGVYVTYLIFLIWGVSVAVMMLQTHRDDRATQARCKRAMNTGKDLRIIAQQEYPELR